METCNHITIIYRPLVLESGQAVDKWYCNYCNKEFAPKIDDAKLAHELTDITFAPREWEQDSDWDNHFKQIYMAIHNFIHL